jgi:PadR family transcriptional regulator, regulatory protein PadR
VGKNDQLLGTLDLLILKTLAQLGSMHGYGMVSHIQHVSDDLLRIEEGSLYPALHRIEETGWITSEWRTSENNRRAKYYQLTARGRKQLALAQQSWARVVKGVTSLLKFA